MEQSVASALIALSIATGSIKPQRFRLGRVADALIVATCVISGTVGVVGLMA